MEVHKSDAPHFRNISLTLNATNEEFQLIYPSQLYGTFFTVSARLVLNRKKTKVKRILLSLTNYRGLYNVGMLISTRDSWEFEDETGIIELNLQAYNGTNNCKLFRELDIPLPKKIKVSELKHIFTTRKVKSFSKSPEIVDHLLEESFDNEFYARNGKYIAEIQRLDDYLPIEDEVQRNKAGGMCMTSTTNVIVGT